MRASVKQILILFVFGAQAAQAQFSSGSIFHIMAGTEVSIDGLLLKPTFSRTLVNKTIAVSSEPILGEPHNSIQRVYTFNEPFSLFGSVGIHYQTGELNENNEAALQIAYYNEAERYVTTSQGTVDVQKHMVFQTFSGKDLLKITAVEGNAQLPVTLVSFSAKKSERQVILSWNTTAETNSDYFEIQRSATGKNWEPLGRVDAAGESTTQQNYTFHDNNPISGINYYRLKMVDEDGSFANSQMKNLTFDFETFFKVFPNPVASLLQIDTGNWSKVKSVEVVSRMGVTVRKMEMATIKESAQKELDLEGLVPGVYAVNMILEDGNVYTLKILKN